MTRTYLEMDQITGIRNNVSLTQQISTMMCALLGEVSTRAILMRLAFILPGGMSSEKFVLKLKTKKTLWSV